MRLKYVLPLALLFALALPCAMARGGDLAPLTDALDNLSDMARSADRAQDAFRDAVNGERAYRHYYNDYDSDWHRRDARRERRREYDMARALGIERAKVHRMRRSGMSWDDIARRHDRYHHRDRYYHDRGRHKGWWHGKRKKHHHDDDDDDD